MDCFDVVAEARAWIGTPYRHQGSCRGSGTDCLGLLRGLWREFIGAEPEVVPVYTADWAENGPREVLLEAAARHLVQVPIQDGKDGDVLVFRLRKGGIAKHIGIQAHMGGIRTIIHAYSGRGVVETPIGEAWENCIAGVFRFPERGA